MNLTETEQTRINEFNQWSELAIARHERDRTELVLRQATVEAEEALQRHRRLLASMTFTPWPNVLVAA